ncbi:MAG: HK97 family phage prohead protease [Bifidobacterium criceti]|nr:HK97 family phage prohead protease [Bifidobacterium criceti]
MTIRIVVGPPASGKTTYVQDHAEPDVLRVDYDALATTLGSASPHVVNEPIRTAAGDAWHEIVDGVLDNAWDAWIIHTHPSEKEIGDYVAAGAEFILIDPGIEQVLEQAEADGRTDETLDAIRAWYDDPPQLPDPQTPDTAGGDTADGAPDDTTDKEHKTVTGMLTKTIRADIKAADTGSENETRFEGYAAVFDNIDLGGDVIRKGAFAKTLSERYGESGAGIPVYWNHDVNDPFKNLGVTSKAYEDEHGLKVEGAIDTSTELGRQVAKLLKEGRVQQMSFAYDIEDAGWIDGTKGDDGGYEPGYYELRSLDLFEVSICPIGCNQQTEVSAKKAMLGLDADEQPTTQENKNTCPGAFPRRSLAARRLQLINL